MTRIEGGRAEQVKAEEEGRRANIVRTVSTRFGPEIAEAAANFVQGYRDDDPQGVIRKPTQELSQVIVNEVGQKLSPEVQAALGRGLEAVLLILDHRFSIKMNNHLRAERARRRGMV